MVWRVMIHILKINVSTLETTCLRKQNFFLFNSLFFSNWRITALTVLCWFLPYNTDLPVSVYISPSSWACLPQLSFLKMLYERGCSAIDTVVSSFRWGLIYILLFICNALTTEVTQYMGHALTMATREFAYFSILF